MEFRAFWGQDQGTHGDTFGSSNKPAKNKQLLNQTPSFKNERQEKVARRILTGDGAYREFQQLYQTDKKFRTVVHNTKRAAGANLINSVRIEALRTWVGKNKSASLKDLKAKAGSLDKTDLLFLMSAEAANFWNQMTGALGKDKATKLKSYVKTKKGGQKASDPKEAEVVVVPGDTLEGVAARYMADASSWMMIHSVTKGRLKKAGKWTSAVNTSFKNDPKAAIDPKLVPSVWVLRQQGTK